MPTSSPSDEGVTIISSMTGTCVVSVVAMDSSPRGPRLATLLLVSPPSSIHVTTCPPPRARGEGLRAWTRHAAPPHVSRQYSGDTAAAATRAIILSVCVYGLGDEKIRLLCSFPFL